MKRVSRILALIIGLAVEPAIAMPPHCQLEQEAAAWTRLEVWAQALAGRNGLLTAHSTHRIAVVADRRCSLMWQKDDILAKLRLVTGSGASGYV